MTSILWFRRDLRLQDNPALTAAANAGSGDVIPLFIIDPRLWQPEPNARQVWLAASLAKLNESVDGRLHLAYGDPTQVLPKFAAGHDARSVHVSRDFGRYGKSRDDRTAAALAECGIDLVPSGSPYAVDPGEVRNGTGGRYRVYTPFFRAWSAIGWPGPDRGPTSPPHWISSAPSSPIAVDLLQNTPAPPREYGAIGEAAALTRWRDYLDHRLAGYNTNRNIPGIEGTSRLSPHLRWGEIHPRTMLADLAAYPATEINAKDIETFRKEIAWREFYAEVWDANPASVWGSLDGRFDEALEVETGDRADERFEAWCSGNTGYPFVDAGMRQLRTEGWMHNRVRMVTASFLVKGLHLPWQRGAAWFMQSLRDGDAASNQQGWQWTAGCGTDAAPFYRIFNPVLQGQRFDPTGTYIRRWVPELAGLSDAQVHEPWKVRGTFADVGLEYPDPIIDHRAERDEALRRYAALPPRS